MRRVNIGSMSVAVGIRFSRSGCGMQLEQIFRVPEVRNKMCVQGSLWGAGKHSHWLNMLVLCPDMWVILSDPSSSPTRPVLAPFFPSKVAVSIRWSIQLLAVHSARSWSIKLARGSFSSLEVYKARSRPAPSQLKPPTAFFSFIQQLCD